MVRVGIQRAVLQEHTSRFSVENCDVAIEVLLVENSSKNAFDFEALLSMEGANVHHVTNGLDAVLACNRKKYDLVVMDLVLPELDGFRSALAIKKMGTFNEQTPILAVSSTLSKKINQKCLEHSMCGVIRKPIDKTAFHEALHAYVRKEDY